MCLYQGVQLRIIADRDRIYNGGYEFISQTINYFHTNIKLVQFSKPGVLIICIKHENFFLE